MLFREKTSGKARKNRDSADLLTKFNFGMCFYNQKSRPSVRDVIPVLAFLRHVLPVASGHVAQLLAGVEALLDADGLEVGAPEVL